MIIDHLVVGLLQRFDNCFHTPTTRVIGWTGLGAALGAGMGLCLDDWTVVTILGCSAAVGGVALMLTAGLTFIASYRRRAAAPTGALPWLLAPTVFAMYVTLMFVIVGFVIACFEIERSLR